MKLALLSCFAFLCWQLVEQRSLAQNSQLDVVQYIEGWHRYKSISYQAKVLQKPEPGAEGEMIQGLQVRQTLKVMYDFRTEDYNVERTYTLAKMNSLTREFRSHVGDELRGYTDDDSPRFKHDRKVVAGGGVVERIVDRKEFAGPEMLIGSPNVTSIIGQRVSLCTLFEQSEPTITDVGSVKISNVFHWPDSTPAVYGIDVQLAPAHGCLPSRIDYIYQNRVQGNELIQTSCVVTRFFQDKATQLWVPVDFSFFGKNSEFQTRVLVDERTVVMNECPPPETYRLEFPTSKIYVNQLTRQRMLDGKPIEQLAPLPRPFGKTERSRWLYSIGAFLVVLAVIIFGFYLVKRRRTVAILLCIGCACSSLGCNTAPPALTVENVTPVTKASEPKVVVDGSGEELLQMADGFEQLLNIRIDPGSKAGFSFPIKNVSDATCVFEPQVRTTCGCTMANLSGVRLAPGESIELRGQVDMSASPGKKAVQLTLVLNEPQPLEIVFLVHAVFEGDWTVSARSVMLQGQIGELQSGEVEVLGKPDVLRAVQIRCTGKVTIDEIVGVDPTVRRFKVEGVPRSLVSREVIGEIVFEHANANPRNLNVLVAASAVTASRWNPSVISLRRGSQREVELSLESKDRLVEVVGNGAITVDKSTASLRGTQGPFLYVLSATPKEVDVATMETALIYARLKRGEFSYDLPVRVVVHD